MAPESLVLSFPYSPHEHAEAMFASRRLRGRLRMIRWGGAVIAGGGVLSAVLAAFAGAPLLSQFAGTLPLVALGAFWFWVAPWLLQQVTRWQYRRESIGEKRTTELREFSPDGFRPSAHWTHPVPWSEVREAVETSRFFLIEASSDEPAYVPKHVLSSEQLAQARSIIRSHVPLRQHVLERGSLT